MKPIRPNTSSATTSIDPRGAAARGRLPWESGLDEHVHDGLHTLVPAGELDLESALTLEATIAQLCAASETRAITLDLSNLMFIDSTGLSVVLLACRLCK